MYTLHRYVGICIFVLVRVYGCVCLCVKVSLCSLFYHIRTVHLYIIKVLFIYLLIYQFNNCNFNKHKLIRSLITT